MISQFDQRITNGLAMKNIAITIFPLVSLFLAGCLSLPESAKIDSPVDSWSMIKLPAASSDTWIATQGIPIKIRWLKEGDSEYEYGRMYLLAHTLSKLPYNNTEESQAWVDHINQTYTPAPAWVHNPERRMGHYKCMSLSAATVIDWHTIDSGLPLGSYTSWLSGEEERGIDHRIIDSLYYKKAAQKEFSDDYPLLTLELDPVERTPISYAIPAFSEIISLTLRERSNTLVKVADHGLADVTHELDLSGLPKLKTVKLFDYQASYKVRADSSHHTKALKQALHKYGPVFAGVRVRFASSGGVITNNSIGRLSVPGMSGHGVVIVGYVEQDNETYFIYRETFGKYDYTSPQGGPAYRIYPAHAFNEAYAFKRL